MIGPDDEVNAPLIELLRGGGVILGGNDYDRARMAFLVPRLRSNKRIVSASRPFVLFQRGENSVTSMKVLISEGSESLLCTRIPSAPALVYARAL